MLPRRSGKIINIASIAGLYGNPPEWRMQTMAYNTSKGALIAMTRTLAAEWGPHNINVNAICPGFFPSKMTKVTLDRIGADVLALTPLGRLGGEEDLKGSVVFLASEASRHITGRRWRSTAAARRFSRRRQPGAAPSRSRSSSLGVAAFRIPVAA
jgi:gluconate 5-dehydrogenase